MIDEFENLVLHWNEREETCHHDQTVSVQASFAQYASSLVRVIEELGNPFEEESRT